MIDLLQFACFPPEPQTSVFLAVCEYPATTLRTDAGVRTEREEMGREVAVPGGILTESPETVPQRALRPEVRCVAMECRR